MTISGVAPAKLALRLFGWVVVLEWVLFSVPPLMALASGLVAAGGVMLPWAVAKGLVHFVRRPREGSVKAIATAQPSGLTPFFVATWTIRVGVLMTAYDFFVTRSLWQDALLAGGVTMLGAVVVLAVAAEVAHATRREGAA